MPRGWLGWDRTCHFRFRLDMCGYLRGCFARLTTVGNGETHNGVTSRGRHGHFHPVIVDLVILVALGASKNADVDVVVPC